MLCCRGLQSRKRVDDTKCIPAGDQACSGACRWNTVITVTVVVTVAVAVVRSAVAIAFAVTIGSSSPEGCSVCAAVRQCSLRVQCRTVLLSSHPKMLVKHVDGLSVARTLSEEVRAKWVCRWQ